jgi:hypothetical protein
MRREKQIAASLLLTIALSSCFRGNHKQRHIPIALLCASTAPVPEFRIVRGPVLNRECNGGDVSQKHNIPLWRIAEAVKMFPGLNSFPVATLSYVPEGGSEAPLHTGIYAMDILVYDSDNELSVSVWFGDSVKKFCMVRERDPSGEYASIHEVWGGP